MLSNPSVLLVYSRLCVVWLHRLQPSFISLWLWSVVNWVCKVRCYYVINTFVVKCEVLARCGGQVLTVLWQIWLCRLFVRALLGWIYSTDIVWWSRVLGHLEKTKLCRSRKRGLTKIDSPCADNGYLVCRLRVCCVNAHVVSAGAKGRKYRLPQRTNFSKWMLYNPASFHESLHPPFIFLSVAQSINRHLVDGRTDTKNTREESI